MKKYFLVSIFIIGLFFVFSPKEMQAAKWVTDVITQGDFNILSGEVINHNVSFALDSENKPHISFYEAAEKNLKYAYYDGQNWNFYTVDSGVDTGKYNSLQVDEQNRPHLAWFYDTNDSLKYAFSSSEGVFDQTTLASGSNAAYYPSLFLDDAGRPHIVYYYSESGIGGAKEFYYTYFTGFNWSGGSLVASPSVVQTSAIPFILDNSQNPHFSYYNASANELRHYVRSGGAWQEKLVTGSGYYPSLALSRQNVLNVCYSTLNPDYTFNLKYGTYQNGAWSGSDTSLVSRGMCSLGFDLQNNPQIAYMGKQDSTSNLSYAVFDGTLWQNQVLDSDGLQVGYLPQLKIDSQGQSHIVYVAAVNPTTQEIRWTYYDSIAPEVSISVPAGVYSKVQNVELETESGAEIYYTTDGSTPTTSSKKYSGQIKISKPTTLKYFAKDSADNESEIETAKYVITPTPVLYQANILVNLQGNKIKIYNRHGKYLKKSFYPFGKKYQGPSLFFTLGDADNDGKNDILVASRSKIKVFNKSGKKKFEIKTPVYRVKVADLNSDGEQEILAMWKNKLKVYSGKKKLGSLKLNSWLRDFTIARLSSPQKPRLVVSTQDDKVRIYQWKKKRFKLEKTKSLPLISNLAVDINNNGRDELLVKKDDGVYLLNSSFKTLAKTKKSGVLAVADINLDNKLEILISDGKTLSAFKKSGSTFKLFKKYRISGISLAGKLP